MNKCNLCKGMKKVKKNDLSKARVIPPPRSVALTVDKLTDKIQQTKRAGRVAVILPSFKILEGE